MADLKAFAEQLVSLTVKEVNELAGILKEEYGIEPAAAAPVMVAGGGGGGEAAAAAPEKTSFDVILKAPGAGKLAVVKLVKDLTLARPFPRGNNSSLNRIISLQLQHRLLPVAFSGHQLRL